MPTAKLFPYFHRMIAIEHRKYCNMSALDLLFLKESSLLLRKQIKFIIDMFQYFPDDDGISDRSLGDGIIPCLFLRHHSHQVRMPSGSEAHFTHALINIILFCIHHWDVKPSLMKLWKATVERNDLPGNVILGSGKVKAEQPELFRLHLEVLVQGILYEP